jgi:cytochrome c-type biogenesis protein CcsB
MANVLFNLAYLSYSVCTLLYLAYLFTKREKFSRLAHSVLVISLAVHALSFVARVASTRSYIPWTNLFETVSLFGAIVAAIYLAISRKNHIPVMGAFIMPVSWALLTAAFLSDKAIHSQMAQPQSYWMAIHVPVMFTSYALLGVAFAAGIAYLIEERQMKSKHLSELSYRLPPLDELDQMIIKMIVVAFPLLTTGILLGAIWAYTAWGRFWGWDPKETWSLITWLVYVGYLVARLGGGWRGRKTAYWSLAGFVFILFTYAGVNYLSPRHAFLSASRNTRIN